VRKIVHIDMDAFYASVEQRDTGPTFGKIGFLIALSDSIRWKSELGIPDRIAKTLDNRIHEARNDENNSRSDAAPEGATPPELSHSSARGKSAVASAG
jgi:hypothetical protein